MNSTIASSYKNFNIILYTNKKNYNQTSKL